MSLSTNIVDKKSKTKKRANELSDLISQKDITGAISLLNKKPDLLHKTGSKGLYPSQILAKQKESQKEISLFKTMLEKGVNPFLTDDDGFCTFYYATIHGSKTIASFCTDFFQEPWMAIGTMQEPSLDEHLARAGFHPYLIPHFTVSNEESSTTVLNQDDTNEMYSFLMQLFQHGTLPEYQSKEKALKKALHKTKSKQLVEPRLLQQIAAGFVDTKLAPETIIALLAKLYPTLQSNQKLACVYLVKEFIRCDIAFEWVQTQSFRDQMQLFISGLDNKTLAQVAVRTGLNNLYQAAFPQEHLASAKALTFDLTKAFHNLMLKISPQKFTPSMLSEKNISKNPAFKAISDMSNNLTYLVRLDILKATSSQRLNRVKFYFDVIAMCLKEDNYAKNEELVYNFAAASAIFMGLYATPVSRLRKIDELLKENKDYARRLAHYNDLFRGNFTALFKESTEHLDSIMPLNMFSAEKGKEGDMSVFNMLSTYGALNQRFNAHYQFLSSLHHFEYLPYKTDCIQVMAGLNFDENYSWALSYQIEPPKVINLDIQPTMDAIIKVLSDMKSMDAPLVINKEGSQIKGSAALGELKAYLELKFPKQSAKPNTKESEEPIDAIDTTMLQKQEIIERAKAVLANFKKMLAIAPMSTQKLTSDVINGIANLSLESTKPRANSAVGALKSLDEDEEDGIRERSKTVLFTSSAPKPGSSTDVDLNTRTSSPSKQHPSLLKTKTLRRLSSPRSMTTEDALESSGGSRTFTPLFKDQAVSTQSAPLISKGDVKEKKKKKHQSAKPSMTLSSSSE